MATPTEIKETLLAAAEAAVDGAAGLLPAGCEAPLVRWISHGRPAVDEACNGQLNVWDSSIRPRAVGLANTNRCAYKWEMVVNVEIWQCVETMTDQGAFPEPAVQQAEAACLDALMWAIVCSVTNQIVAGQFAGAECGDIQLGEVTPEGPSGATAGRRWTLTIPVDCA